MSIQSEGDIVPRVAISKQFDDFTFNLYKFVHQD